jgi:homoserine O-acetyltransferase/O-succinyltransferase
MKNFTHTFREDLLLENGSSLSNVVVQYATLGTYIPGKSKVIWICHALTANSDAVNWWPGLVGENFLYNSEEHFIICANIIGSCYGSSGPLTQGPSGKPYYIDFPQVSIRDMVAVHELLRKHLGIDRIDTCIGGSLGGQQALDHHGHQRISLALGHCLQRSAAHGHQSRPDLERA